jgi:phosphatidate cytidylyltransferase
MKSRILTALVALPILIAAIILPYLFPQLPELKYLFVALAAAAIVLGLYEFFLMTKKMQLKADVNLAFLGASAFFVAFFFDAPTTAPDFLILTTALFVIAVFISQAFRFRADFNKLLNGLGVTLAGVFWVAFLGGFLVAMRVGFENGNGLSTKLLSFLFLIIFGSDVGAYFAGKYLGKRKLAEKISPNKTWEGFFGGIVTAIGFAVLSHFWFFQEFDLRFMLPLTLVMTIVGVLGDLAESAIKRSTGTKDAANFLPGHGGLLDRLDSLLFNAPILYYFAKFYFGA